MSAFFSRPYEGASDLPLLIRFAQRATQRRLPSPSYYHPGDFVWQLYAESASEDVRLWFGSGSSDLVACAILEPPRSFEFEVDPLFPRQDELLADVLGWAASRRDAYAGVADDVRAYRWLGEANLATSAFESDALRIDALARAGYARREEETGFRTERRLDGDLPEPELPSGARFVTIASDADIARRAELHRSAWSVWGESQHSTERYRLLRGAPLYDPDLDVVLEFAGELVSYCVCWPDTHNGVGLFEPVGTRPTAARRGFARAVLYDAFRRLRARGMETAVVTTGTVNAPARALYASAGFEVVDVVRTYSLA